MAVFYDYYIFYGNRAICSILGVHWLHMGSYKTYPETLLSSSGHANVSKESLTKSSQEVRCDSLKTRSDRCSLGRPGLGLFSDMVH